MRHWRSPQPSASSPALLCLIFPDKLVMLIRNPLSVNPQASMPAFDKLSDEDLKALVAYLLTLK